ncbi:hypothetical protein [Streptomyces agglomeratus]|uniref:hypothetical protein n=1 Tax=Streptomyces agglomeratus TaxID=285458 RepID=UPI00085414FF|nr:hypothetical protein [Streptomyces agglomeratus]
MQVTLSDSILTGLESPVGPHALCGCDLLDGALAHSRLVRRPLGVGHHHSGPALAPLEQCGYTPKRRLTAGMREAP